MAEKTILVGGVTSVVENCLTCGIPYAVPLSVYENNRAKGGWHHCPNGHQQGWSKERSEDGVIRRERDRLKQQAAQKDDEIRRLRERADQADRRASAFKGQATKMRNRAKAGVCPCCNRTFQNLQRHMNSQHPDFEAEAPEPTLTVVNGGKQ